jgi:tRNA-2-methylthio-N6-dimethylallyladenosine synthase
VAEVAGADDPRLSDDVPAGLPRPGDLLTVRVTQGAPHHLIADSALGGGPYTVRRTRSGDAWALRERARLGLGGDEHTHAAGPSAAGSPVLLGMPTLAVRT